MPMDASRYPDDWRDISQATKERAGWVCEWGGAPHDTWIYRRRDDPWRWDLMDEVDQMNSDAGAALVGWDPIMTRVVLTVHHLGIPHEDGTPGSTHDKHDNRPDNLVACCQRCHLLLDLGHHRERAAETRRRKRDDAIRATGQLRMTIGSE